MKFIYLFLVHVIDIPMMTSYRGKNPGNWSALRSTDADICFRPSECGSDLHRGVREDDDVISIRMWKDEEKGVDEKKMSGIDLDFSIDFAKGATTGDKVANGVLIGEVSWCGSQLYKSCLNGILVKRFKVEASEKGRVHVRETIRPFTNRHITLDTMMSLATPSDSGRRTIKVEFHAPDELQSGVFKFVYKAEFWADIGYSNNEYNELYKNGMFNSDMNTNNKLCKVQSLMRNNQTVVHFTHEPVTKHGLLATKPVDETFAKDRAEFLAEGGELDYQFDRREDVGICMQPSLIGRVMFDLKRQLDAANKA